MQNIPIIDVSPLRSANPAQRATCAAELGRVCRDIGFFYATGHGMEFADRAVVDQIVAAVRPKEYGFRTLLHALVQSPTFRSK